MGVITPMMMLSSILMIFLTSPSLAWIVAVSVPFLAVVVIYVAVKTKPLSEKQQKTLDKINQYVRENLTGLRVIRAFAREEFQEKRFSDENEVYAQNSNKLFKLTGLTEPLFVQIIIAMMWPLSGLPSILCGTAVLNRILLPLSNTAFTPCFPSFSWPISLLFLGRRYRASGSRKSWICPFQSILMKMV